MNRYRLYPRADHETVMREHCAHARFVWNLGHEQRSEYRPGRGPTPGFIEQCRQLTEARAAEPWLAAGSCEVQRQALRDLDQAWRNFFAGTHRKPGWRKQGQHEGFRITDFTFALHVQRLNRRWGQVRIPKVGWVRFRWSRAVPPEAKSYRVKLDAAGRWHVSFCAWPARTVSGPGTGEVVGIDRGVAVSLALSNGEMLKAPTPRSAERLHRRLSRAKRGGSRRQRAKVQLARARVRDADRLKDWAEKASTDIARRFDVIRIEDLKIQGMTRSTRGTIAEPGRNVRQKAGLNRAILAQGWGLFARRLDDKAPGRIERVEPNFTSQRCSACGQVDGKSRESQARFRCTACGFTLNADVNAAKNIAAGRAVTARGGTGLPEPANREPLASAA